MLTFKQFTGINNVLPEHRLKGKTPEALQKDADYTRMACGWGPYMVKEWVAGFVKLDDGTGVVSVAGRADEAQ